MVLAGGPDRERVVSLMSGAEASAALRDAGHQVIQRDIRPGQLSALREFTRWQGDVVFPMLHGRWGEGGGLQRVLDHEGLPYVGCTAAAAELCIDKTRTKQVLQTAGLPTPRCELIDAESYPTLKPPLVLKPNDDGSSIDLAICHDAHQVRTAWQELSSRNPKLLVEQFVKGKELTVGVIDRPVGEAGGAMALPPIEIIATTAFYDYQAKYCRDDTRYLFDIDLPQRVLDQVKQMGRSAHVAVGARHLSRADFMVDEHNRIWLIEINTIPGFTTHSLLPMAARRQGITMPQLVDRLARLVMDRQC